MSTWSRSASAYTPTYRHAGTLSAQGRYGPTGPGARAMAAPAGPSCPRTAALASAVQPARPRHDNRRRDHGGPASQLPWRRPAPLLPMPAAVDWQMVPPAHARSRSPTHHGPQNWCLLLLLGGYPRRPAAATGRRASQGPLAPRQRHRRRLATSWSLLQGWASRGSRTEAGPTRARSPPGHGLSLLLPSGPRPNPPGVSHK